VGKTTTAASLGPALAEHDKRVLLIDFDPQGSLSSCFGINSAQIDKTIYNALLEKNVYLRDVILKTNIPSVDLAPANIDLSAAEILLVNEISRERVLSRALKQVDDEYDFTLIDCPPSLGILTINALSAAHRVLIPVQCSYLAMRGLKQLTETIEKIKESTNPDLSILGILLTRFDRRTLHAREVVDRIRERFNELVFNTIINATVRFDEAPVAGEPVLFYASDSKGAVAYRDLAKEILNHGK
jgi:chromosome partitioning protein